MRFEVGAAYTMGVVLPVFEALRRRTNFENFHGYVDDFIAGGLLLYAAYAVTRDQRRGPVLLAVAWAVLCGGLYGSFFWQFTSTAALDVGGLPNMTMVIIKGVLWAISFAALVLSVRATIARQSTAEPTA